MHRAPQTRLLKQLQTEHTDVLPCRGEHLFLAGCWRAGRAWHRALHRETEGSLRSSRFSEYWVYF